MSTLRWSAPGSALIAGEYRVTEEGGIGVAVACGGRARMTCEDSEKPDFRGTWPSVHESDAPGRRLANTVLETLSGQFREYFIPSVSVVVDTGSFFDKLGRKRGFGSSAAAALLFAKAMAPDADPESLTQAAIEAHRIFQGGRGSGYDILTSSRGGAGLFVGGQHPSWESLSWPDNIENWLLKGPSPVKTPEAVGKYQQWKRDHTNQYHMLMREMDSVIKELRSLEGDDCIPWIDHIKKLADIGIRLGDQIGVPARPHDFGGLGKDLLSGLRNGAVLKCLGAGDELILLISEKNSLGNSEKQLLTELEQAGKAERLVIEHDGLRDDLV
jgi:phosphomevalonate kinase